MKSLLLSFIFYVLLSNQCFANSAQSRNTKYTLRSPSEFVFESYPNQPLIPIRLLGAVKNAGLYHVPTDMKLTTLLTLAGGTSADADLEKIIIGNDLKEIKDNKGNNQKSITLNLEQVIQDGAKQDYVLGPNDIVLVKNKSPFVSNDSFRIISIVSVVLTSLLTAVLIKDKLDDK